jgi:hypothetical protein
VLDTIVLPDSVFNWQTIEQADKRGFRMGSTYSTISNLLQNLMPGFNPVHDKQISCDEAIDVIVQPATSQLASDDVHYALPCYRQLNSRPVEA